MKDLMKGRNTLAGNVTFNQIQDELLLDTKGEYMKESNILAIIKQVLKGHLLDTKEQFMIGSNTLAHYATIMHLQKEIWFNIKGLYMKE